MLRSVDGWEGEHFSFGAASAAATAAPTQIAIDNGSDGPSATIPDSHLLFTAQFSRAGADLVLIGEDGKAFVVHDYFATDVHARLLSPEGAALSPDVVAALAGPQAPGQYAQAGTAQPPAQAIGRVVQADSDATIVRNGVAMAAHAGDAILKGDVLQTVAGTFGVTFNDGSTLNLTANSRLVVNEFVYDPKGSANSQLLDLVQGSLTFISGEVAHNGDMKIGTPVATMAIRGTVGGVTTANDGTVNFYVSQSATGAVILDSRGNIIANVVQDGPMILVRPVGPLQVLAEEIQKTPVQLATELAALQQILSIKAIGDQILQQNQQPDPNATPNPQSTDKPHTQFQIDLHFINPNGPNGTPDPNDGNPAPPTSATVTQTTTDGDGNKTTTVEEVKIPANLAPLTFGPLQQTANEDTALVFSSTHGNAISVFDADTASLTVTVAATHGVLSLSGVAGLTFTSGDGSGDATMTFSGTQDSINAALEGMSFTPAAEYSGQASVSVTTTDGHSTSATDTIDITVAAVNDAPVIAQPNSPTMAYTENQAPTSIDAVVTLSDVDSATLWGATVTISANFHFGQDVLSFADQNGITANYDSETGVLTLSGVASVADYQAALRSVAYANTSDDPSAETRTISYQVDDGAGAHNLSNTVTATVTVTPVNDAPTVDLTPAIVKVPIPSPLPEGTDALAVQMIAPAMSNDGRWVVFFSDEQVPNGGNNSDKGDVYLYDRLTNATTVLTDAAHIPAKHTGEFFSGFSISGDGSNVVFRGVFQVADEKSPTGFNSVSHIYVYDRDADTVHVLNNPAIGQPFTVNDDPRFAGGQIVFASTDFGDNTGPPVRHIYVTDLTGHIQTDITLALLGIPDPNLNPNDSVEIQQPDISANGNYVTFWAVEKIFNPEDGTVTAVGDATLYTYDLATNTAQIIATSSGSNDDNWWAPMSNDGRYVVFQSDSKALDTQAGGVTNDQMDIFVFDRETNNIVGVTDNTSFHANGASYRATISANGSEVIFASVATNLVPGDTNGQGDTFVYDVANHTFTRVSVASDGSQGNGDSTLGSSISAGNYFQGAFVAFASTANNLVSGDTNGTSDVFVVDRTGGIFGSVTEDHTTPAFAGAPGNTLSTHGAFNFSDVDLTDTHTASVIGFASDTSKAPGFTVPGGELGTFTPTIIESPGGSGQGQVAWTFTVDNAAVQGLNGGQSVSEIYTVQISDGHGGVVAQDVTIVIGGTSDAPTIVGTTSTGQFTNPTLSATAASYLTASHDLINGLGGPSRFGTQYLAANDDESTGAINITDVFGAAGLNFFGHSYTSLYVNNNGNVTFGGASGAYTPHAITASSLAIIAPFWADIDTSGGATSAGTDGHSTGSNLVYYNLDSVNHVMTVTWDDVGYYSGHTNLANAFQLQLIGTGEGDFDIVMRYESINWTAGDASGGNGGSGGIPARAGYSAGDGIASHTYEFSQSGNQSAMLALDSTVGNSGIVGVNVFRVESGNVTAAAAVSGAIAFSDADVSDTHSAMVQEGGESFIGTFALEDPNNDGSHVMEANGTGSVGWHFNLTSDEIASVFTDGAATQSYDVTIADNQQALVSQTISISFASNGADTFHFNSEAHLGANTILNFNIGADTIVLEGYDSITDQNLLDA
ncbi:MAG: nidogen-like domain-containing protein, partial [Pseudolabrys sp.]|nr:nidogen-like domain-containing protein [Pseudolabrys sp.]